MDIDTDLKIRLLENDLEIKEEKIAILTESLAGSKEELILLTNRMNEAVCEKKRIEELVKIRISEELEHLKSVH